ncbi:MULTISPECIES: glycoside hydrolase family 19 protein [Enterobacteriaceae]|uniref:glycoside hydrolase family 19 protein n=1 Tax=Enterobacteriaceae TaxID=543 RepID=UPI002E287DA6|nr:glycoside hydrolase family 19 protein [Klebsiella pneumoniae]MED6004885.1 glycoside hydrolase family 19 protein [Klebsiella pneumoniae]MED6058301.1 glycoside hydrolase family 19 protein [Klebsiella pneumoniae]
MKLTKGGFDIIRKAFGKLSESQVSAFNHIVSAIDADKSISYPQAAYILATIWHETARTMLPIAEYGKGNGRPYGTWLKNSKGQLYCYKDGSKSSVYLHEEYPHLYYGRGETQNTWFANYEKLSKVFGVDFLHNPDLLLTQEWSTPVTIYSMKTGLYTGKKLSDYIHQSKKDYVNARRIINGTDKANLIAGYADTFEKALRSL